MTDLVRMLEEGDVIELTQGQAVYIVALPDKKFLGCWPSATLAEIKDELKILAGRYVVYKTAMEGGGTGHGPFDFYPDGHHVYCEKLDDPQFKVSFYQSGCFTAMLPDIVPIGKAERYWKVKRIKKSKKEKR